MLKPKQLEELRATKGVGPNRVALAIKLTETTQVEVAKAIGVTQPVISMVINGGYARGVTLGLAQKLATHFGCATDDLFPPATKRRSRAA